MKKKSLILAGLAIVSSASLVSCDKGSKDTDVTKDEVKNETVKNVDLKSIYYTFTNEYVSMFNEVPHISYYPSDVHPETADNVEYTSLSFRTSYAKESFILEKHFYRILEQCDFTYDDYKKIYLDKNFKVELGTYDMDKFKNDDFYKFDFDTLCNTKQYYYSESLQSVLKPFIKIEDSEWESKYNYKTDRYVTTVLVEKVYFKNAIIKGNTLMTCDEDYLKFIHHPHLSETYIAKMYAQNKNKTQTK